MRVLFVAREYPPFEVGGIARHTFHLVKYLRELGISCKVISFGDKKFSSDDVTFINPSSSIINRSNSQLVSDLKIPLDIARFSRTANSLIKKERFDIVHVEEPYVGAFVRHERKVTTFHTTGYGDIRSLLCHLTNFSNFKRAVFFTFVGLYLELMSIASSRVVIVPFSHIGRELSDVYMVPKEKVRVILNGVTLPQLPRSTDKTAAKQKLGIPPEQLLIFTVARYVFRKRLDTLVEAVGLLHREGVDGYRVVIAGDGPLRPYIKSLVERRFLKHVIELPGWVSEEKLDLYRKATDIFVLTSEYESGPLSLLEAMSYGTAVISSKIDGFPMLIRNGVDGLLFPVGDHIELSNCIRSLLNDIPRLLRMSTSARHFAEKFDLNVVAEETKNVYRSLL
jgi:glycosyltransferase involved in cell wall biosynthesis